MHIFSRRHSRNHNQASPKHEKSPPPPPPSLPSSSASARQPLVPPTNLNYNSSQSSLLSDDSLGGSSSTGSQKSRSGRSRDEQERVIISKAVHPKATRSERSNTINSIRDGNPAAMPTAVLSSPQGSPYSSHPDLYTHNALNSFSFGAASSTTPVSRSVDPLSPRDDGDSEEYRFKADTTPRPSLAGPSTRPEPTTMPELLQTSLPPPPRHRYSPQRRRRKSNASTHTFGTSSASASATSLSSNAVDSSTESRRGGSMTTPHTSANEFTSDDEEVEHRHPFAPSGPLSPSDGYPFTSDGEDDEEDFDDDYLERDDSEPEIDISSEMHEDVDDTAFTEFHHPSRDSLHSMLPRRGSIALPVPIPSPSTYEGRDREDSIATLRRPSRSMDELKSDSLAQEQRNSSHYGDNRGLTHAPTSVPESEGDWRDLRRRSVQKEQEGGKESHPSHTKSLPSVYLTSSSRGSLNEASSSSGAIAAQNSALDGFDSSWVINPALGIVDLDWDQSEMADIVGGFQGPRSSDRSFNRRGSSSSTVDSGRRLSTTSTNSDPFTRGLNKWGGQQYADERMKWTFIREKADRLEENRIANERERNSISSLFSPRSNGSTTSMIGSSAGFQDQIAPFREKERKDKEKGKEPAVWKGMAIDAEEWWSSYSNGRYRVLRKSMSSTESGKPPQQRLNVAHHRTPYSWKRDLSDGPSVTIHKHSKAVGFSISRHYRPKVPSASSGSGRMSTSSRSTSAHPPPADKKKPSSMILLAARKVQEAYTSTTTTRMLEHHGLLNENGRQSSRDIERLEREKREKKKKELEMEKQRLKELKKKESRLSKIKSKSKASNILSNEPNVASSSESSAGSVANDVPSTSDLSTKVASSSKTRASVDYSIKSNETASSDRTIVWSQRRPSEYDDREVLEDDDDDGFPKPPSRTPHGETYATLPPEAFETFAAQRESKNHGFFSWSKAGGNSLLQRHIDRSYKPPWAVAQARFHPDRKGIVEDLNTSFQDVGLLPAVDELKNSGLPHKRKRHPHSETRGSSSKSSATDSPNVFHSFSADYIYMLLPLWPGETDSSSNQKYPFKVPHIPVESRQYLLIYYKPDDVPPPPEAEKLKNGRDGKKRSRTSPTSSRDSVGKQVEKGVLYDKFHFCARIVSYSDIQGSGVRSPDAGLSVLGPLQEAYETMPRHALIDTFQVVGVCSSREKGIEFVPEGLEKLGLTRRIPDPSAMKEEDEESSRLSLNGLEEQDEPSDTTLILTPIGRAVAEMAWLGAMALTSFGPGS
ncbi:hypothetical protein FA15DRAFT_667406 [Coprinopsis marcescibilis]|uniref:Uncharacterized protein n=1 Tax=Coprinopsis marcescibilis TaxID=230819 RepID=A0A5C3L0N8_COPMA|nr:hypothetical protein FA15DRAFT_667406 [Coprinopsis marcescibilis]